MIEILKDGRPRHDITCHWCHSELRYMDDDIQAKPTGFHRSGYDIELCRDTYQSEIIKYIICPVCDKVIMLDKEWVEY